MAVGADEVTQSLKNVSLVICTISEWNCVHFYYVEELICEERSDFKQLFVRLELEEHFFV